MNNMETVQENIVTEYLEHNKALEQSPEFQTVLLEILQCREFVNADEIARGLSPFNPESVAIEAGRLMLICL